MFMENIKGGNVDLYQQALFPNEYYVGGADIQ